MHKWHLKSSMFLPQKIMTNDDLSKIVDTNDAWIVQRTGIRQRHVCSEHENALSMAIETVKRLNLSEDEIQKIDVIIVATSTHQPMPSIASSVHAFLNARKNVTAFDLNDACNGFVQAMTVACKYTYNTQANALVIGVDHMTSILDWSDRGTCILFGDGAGALLISGSAMQNVEYTSYTLGEFNDAIVAEQYIKMDGNKVFMQAVQNIAEDILNVLQKSNLHPNDVDYYIIHQANIRILNEVARKLQKKHKDFDASKIVTYIENMANTSAATIPITFDSIKDKMRDGAKIMMSGFAAGLRGGSILIY